MSESRRCNNCGGTGLAVNGAGMRIKCPECGGGGYIPVPVPVPVRAPAARTNKNKIEN